MSGPTIYYIRHGETQWNADGRLQGVQDTALNDLGRSQAAQAGRILADLLVRDGRDKSVLPYVSSPLLRARTTMEIMRKTLSLPVPDYATDDRLREIGYGQWEGFTLAEMQAAVSGCLDLRGFVIVRPRLYDWKQRQKNAPRCQNTI